jgi:hypothetical protein
VPYIILAIVLIIADSRFGIEVAQFLLADISGIRASIKEETGIDIVGIVSYPQMQFAGITLSKR